MPGGPRRWPCLARSENLIYKYDKVRARLLGEMLNLDVSPEKQSYSCFLMTSQHVACVSYSCRHGKGEPGWQR